MEDNRLVSRYRTVHCLIWNDDKFPFVSDDLQLVFFHLKTSMLSTPIGICKTSLEALAAEKRWPLERYRQTFQEGLSKGFWKIDERSQIVMFTNYFAWNTPPNPNVLKSWIKFYEEVPNCDLKNESIQSLKTFSKVWGKPFVKVSERLGQTIPKQEQEQEQEYITPPTPPIRGSLSGFETFWLEYPNHKKKSKGSAEKAWKKLSPNEQLQGLILAALKRAKTSEEWAKDAGRYVPYPATWLNGKRWQDEYGQGDMNAPPRLRFTQPEPDEVGPSLTPEEEAKAEAKNKLALEALYTTLGKKMKMP